MPIYEFQCNDCNMVFEVLVTSSTKKEEIVCSHCKSTHITKIISGSGYKLASGAEASRSGQQHRCNPKGGFS
jgi:putative FmdB family regulatory protein